MMDLIQEKMRSYLDWIELVSDSAGWLNSVTRADNNEKDKLGVFCLILQIHNLVVQRNSRNHFFFPVDIQLDTSRMNVWINYIL